MFVTIDLSYNIINIGRKEGVTMSIRKGNPFIPYKKADTVIVDGRGKKIIDKLVHMGINVIPTIKHEKLYEAISYHPDIILHPINYTTLIVEPSMFYYYKDKLRNTNIKLIKGEKHLGKKYPDNIAYNVARVSKYAIHNLKYTDEKLLYYLKKEGIEFIDVNQGYTKCSIANLSENTIITSDPSIYNKALKYGIDVLYIKEGFIKLPGLDYGFIGGTCGLLRKKEILFTGKYEKHIDYNNIEKFLKKHEVKPIFLSNKEIIDLGSIIPLLCN